jgi:DNA-binding PadR family transcriptional regulator
MNALTPDETILGLLAAQPQHGYQLLEIFNDPDQLGLVWNMSTSQLYAVIKRLERQGFISGREVLTENAPPRTEYALTETGQSQLGAWLEEAYPSASVRRVRVEFLSRLYIARLLERPTASIVARQRQMCELERARHLHSRQSRNPQGMGWLTSEFVVAQLEAILQWIDRCEGVIFPV